jgi:hypothetical protein
MKGEHMTDVKTLIAALTTERDAIDRAISGLQQMSEIRSGQAQATPKPKTRRRAAQPRIRLSDESKAQIVTRMAAAKHGEHRTLARALAQEFGARDVTIYTGWQEWEKRIGNGAEATPQ